MNQKLLSAQKYSIIHDSAASHQEHISSNRRDNKNLMKQKLLSIKKYVILSFSANLKQAILAALRQNRQKSNLSKARKRYLHSNIFYKIFRYNAEKSQNL